MKKTVYRYCESHAEIKLSNYPDIAALKRDHETVMTAIMSDDPDSTMDFDTREQAAAHLSKNFPTVRFSGKMGTALPYVLCEGAYIIEVEQTLDPDSGEVVDDSYAGTCETSGFPPVTVMNSDGHEVDFDAAVNMMDDEIREELHRQGIDDPQEFFSAHADAYREKYDEDWAPDTGMVW